MDYGTMFIACLASAMVGMMLGAGVMIHHYKKEMRLREKYWKAVPPRRREP